MAIIVKKFGGTSLGSIDLICNIAHRIALEAGKGDSLVLIVSAMAKTTDELINLAYQISEHPSRRELDMLLTAGERISMSLLSLALQEEGYSSISFTGSQSGIITDERHGNARILNVNAFRIKEELEKGKIVIVAGFQGVSQKKEITTLGRGGSDTSAVALACYLQANKCEIYTDVDGIYTADPRIVPDAKLIPALDYSQILALSYNGFKVIHSRAVEFAYKYNIPVEVKSSFTFAPGTMLVNEKSFKEEDMEERHITAIAHKENLISYILPETEKSIHLLKNWNWEIFKYTVTDQQIELIIEDKYDKEIRYLLNQNEISILKTETGIGYVTLVGLGINLDPSFLAETLTLCHPFHIKRIQHSEKTIELMLPSSEVKDCVCTLHSAFIGSEK
ncbi:MAG: aspartate kinase [Candidatus Cloacimonadaceae bacterium]|jgi:aspartate kinase|nr:aspartate kinase [Candidatus Cloacimonadota bacterium]MDY0112542.1 aspartate kinase [Candidatus Syntrophosphaera sp.]